MPTITTGTFYVTRQAVTASVEGGTFTITLHLVDRQGAHQVEPYVAQWRGEAARTWWQEHQQQVRPGTPLNLVLHNPRSFPGPRSPETHATVHSCDLAPLAPTWPPGASRAQPLPAQPT